MVDETKGRCSSVILKRAHFRANKSKFEDSSTCAEWVTCGDFCFPSVKLNRLPQFQRDVALRSKGNRRKNINEWVYGINVRFSNSLLLSIDPFVAISYTVWKDSILREGSNWATGTEPSVFENFNSISWPSFATIRNTRLDNRQTLIQ